MTWTSSMSSGYSSLEEEDSEEYFFTARTSFFRRPPGKTRAAPQVSAERRLRARPALHVSAALRRGAAPRRSPACSGVRGRRAAASEIAPEGLNGRAGDGVKRWRVTGGAGRVVSALSAVRGSLAAVRAAGKGPRPRWSG